MFFTRSKPGLHVVGCLAPVLGPFTLAAGFAMLRPYAPLWGGEIFFVLVLLHLIGVYLLALLTMRPLSLVRRHQGGWTRVFALRSRTGPVRAAGKTLFHPWAEVDGRTVYGNEARILSFLEPAEAPEKLEPTADGFRLRIDRPGARVPAIYAALWTWVGIFVGLLLLFAVALGATLGSEEFMWILFLFPFYGGGAAVVAAFAMLLQGTIAGLLMALLRWLPNQAEVEMIGRTLRWQGRSLALDGTLRTETALRSRFTLVLRTDSGSLTLDGAPHQLLWLQNELERVAATLPEERAEEHVPAGLRALQRGRT